MRRPLVVHPLLIAVFPVLFLYVKNVYYASLPEAVTIAAGAALVTSIIWWLLYRLTGSSTRAGLMVTAFLAAFFFYGYAFNLVEGAVLAGVVIGRHKYLLAVWALLLLALVAYLFVSRRPLLLTTRFLNIVGIMLLLVSLANLVQVMPSGLLRSGSGTVPDTPIASAPASLPERPDIYYIILDMYANPTVMADMYNYSNGEFLAFLEGKGFTVAGNSRSNYATTQLSLAASLNMTYVNDILQTRPLPPQLLKDFEVLRFVKQRGYRVVHFSSGLGPTNNNPNADANVHCGWGSDFLWALLQNTVLSPVISSDEIIRQRILCTFSELANVVSRRGPKFVFAHIITPHPPYVFGPNGESVPGTEKRDVGRYLDQLSFVNKKMTEVVSAILAGSTVPPIIVIQSDHGPDLTFGSNGWDQPTPLNLREKMSILNAYHLPGGGNARVYPTISPVNSFRLIFNEYFGAGLDLLPDESYFSNYIRPEMLQKVPAP